MLLSAHAAKSPQLIRGPLSRAELRSHDAENHASARCSRGHMYAAGLGLRRGRDCGQLAHLRGARDRPDDCWGPVPGILVELQTYGEAGCGTEPSIAFSSAKTDFEGRYRVQQDEPTGVLSGCLRLLAYPDSSGLSEPTAIADLPVDSVQVIEGETVFTVDLTLP
jgi:hypothetical protein